MNMPFFKSSSRPSTGFASVDAIRDRLENMDFVRSTNVDALRRAQTTAITSNAIENSVRSAEEIAFDKLMIELRVPAGPVRRQATEWLLSYMLEKA